jgi:hypothetical protein
MDVARKSPPWRRYGVWAFGFLALGAVVLIVAHLGELGHLVDLVRHAAPLWLLAALALQVLTYVVAAIVWHVALRYAAEPRPLITLLPLGLAKLFADQAVPSGGLSGTLLVMRALTRRNVPRPLTMAVLLVALISYYTAYIIATVAAVMILALIYAVGPAVMGIVAAFLVTAIGIPAGVLWFRKLRMGRLQSWLTRLPGVARLANDIAHAPTHLVRDAPLVLSTTTLQLAVFVLDAATLYAVLCAIGQNASPPGVFASFMISSVTALISPVPLGLGVFEGASVATLHLVGIELEAGLAATLLLRGLTFWLPMLPGLWLARRELRGA